MPEVNITSDRRVFERIPVKLHVDFKDVSWDFDGEGETNDISGSGFRVTTNRKLDVDDLVEFQVKLPDAEKPLKQSGFVVWTQEASGREWVSGVRFREVELLSFWKVLRSLRNT